MGSINNPNPSNLFLTRLFRGKPTVNAHFTADYLMPGDIYANSILIDAGITIRTNDYRIFCLSSLINNGTISNDAANGNDGNDLAGGTGGTNAGLGVLKAGTNGANGVYGLNNGASAVAAIQSYGSRGGAGGSAGAFGGGGSPPLSSDTYNVPGLIAFQTFSSVYQIQSLFAFPYSASQGGGSGGCNDAISGSGGGGAGGSQLAIFAQSITNNGTITCRGGNGGNPYPLAAAAVGGSGGGGGGLIYLAYSNITPGTIDVSGGTGSAGVAGGTNGFNGTTGTILHNTLL